MVRDKRTLCTPPALTKKLQQPKYRDHDKAFEKSERVRV